MPNYPCPPVGFQFTEENFLRARAFYAEWLDKVATYRPYWLKCSRKIWIDNADMANPIYLPWTVQHSATFIETPLPEGEALALQVLLKFNEEGEVFHA